MGGTSLLVMPPLFPNHKSKMIPGLNSKVLDKIITTLGLQSAVEKLPTSLSTTIQPVIDASPEEITDIVVNSTVTGVMLSLDDKRDFFVTYVSIASSSVNQAASNLDNVTATLESGKVVTLCSLITSTAATGNDSGSNSISFDTPVKLKKGTNINSVKGSTSVSFLLGGFYRDIL